MASQTILIVDDSPVNLKLTDIVLRKEGFEVHAAANAEQALLILRGFRPDLMIVDIQLPGISGVELTRRVRQDPRLQDVPVVALTASASKEDEKRALEAGCNGYLTKPIETRTLGRTIRRFLEPEPAREEPVPETPPIPAGLSFQGPEMEGLRRRFLEEGILQSRQMLESLRINFDVERAGSTVHRWVGAAGVLGYAAISSLSREAGDLLGASKLDRGRLREVFSELALAFLDPREATIGPLPEGIAQEISGKRVAMIEFAPEEAERLCNALDHVGALPRMFDATEPGDSRSLRECHVIVVHVRPESPVPLWLLAGEPGPNRPTVLLGGRDAIMALPRPAQSLVREYLIDGWEPEEALLRLSFAIFRNRSSETAPASSMPRHDAPLSAERTQILLADDDRTVLGAVGLTLEEYGFECLSATTGAEALQIARDYRPRAAVLDVNMPDLSGFDVLRQIRCEDIPTRVLLLTARRQEADVVRGFSLGADDYVMKPFNSVELVARLKRFLRN